MRRFLTGVALVATLLAGYAAPPTFTVEAPAWHKLAMSKSDEGVNIRKSPSTTAPKLVYDENKIDNYQIPLQFFAHWSSATKLGDGVYPLKLVELTPVVGEKNGWLELANVGPQMKENGWVSARYCDVVTPGSVFPGEYGTDNFMWLKSDDGNYAIYCTYDEMDGYGAFYVGREIDGMMVFPYRLFCDSFYMDDDKKCDLYISLKGNKFVYTSAQTSDGMSFDLYKLPEAVRNSIVKRAEKIDRPLVVYRWNGDYRTADF